KLYGIQKSFGARGARCESGSSSKLVQRAARSISSRQSNLSQHGNSVSFSTTITFTETRPYKVYQSSQSGRIKKCSTHVTIILACGEATMANIDKPRFF